jgi:hypothetical protein
MATTPSPTTPMRSSGLHRSFTLPTNLGDTHRSPTTPTSPDPKTIETLFEHPNGKIVSFSPPLPLGGSRASLSPIGTEDELIGVLPWASHTERTIAAGL